MTAKLATIFILLSALTSALAACNSAPVVPTETNTGSTPSPTLANPQPGDDVVATIHGEPINMKQLQDLLIEGYGLNDLLLLAKLNIAHQELAKLKMVVTQVDIDTEKQITLVQLKRSAKRISNIGGPSTEPDDDDISPEDAQKLLDQVMSQEHLSIPEFNIIMETNACLRKIVGPAVAQYVNDDTVREQFNAEYGEKAQTQYIVCRTPTQMADVQRDLAAGKPFDEVAKAHSLDTVTAPNGGELFPFTRKDTRIPEIIREAAFALKDGQVSDMIQYKDFLYVIKLVGRIPPEHAKFEDYKDSVRKDLVDQLMQAAMQKEREALAKMATSEMLTIKNPLLAEQFQQRVEAANGQIRDKKKIADEMDQRHGLGTTQPAPTTNPFENPAATLPTAPAPAPASTEPATATMPAAR